MKRLLVILVGVAALVILAVSAPSFCWQVANGIFLNQFNPGHLGFSGSENTAVSPVLAEDDGNDDNDSIEGSNEEGDDNEGKDEDWSRSWDSPALS